MRIEISRMFVSVMLCVCLILSAFSGCATNVAVTEPEESTVTFKVTLQTAGGTPIEKARVLIYSGDFKESLVDRSVTDEEGTVTFSGEKNGKYTAVLENLPGGYDAEQSYALSGEDTIIMPSVGTMTDGDFDSVTYSLGDAVKDFSVTDTDGNTYTLFDLLEQKKAVVLNFWYLECSPCKMEFPYVQQAYEQFSEDVALIAMNPMNAAGEAVRSFREQNGYTFPMAVCDSRWGAVMKLNAYPTTVVIDRYGNICLIHSGMVTDSEPLVKMLEYFTSDDYEQKFLKSISQIPA